MLATERAVLVRYVRDGQARRGSGLRVGGRLVLTADHCAAGADHQVEVAGHKYEASVLARTNDKSVDIAVLEVPDLPTMERLGCARVDRTVADVIEGCRALGFPVWKDRKDGPRLAQVDGDIPTAEGVGSAAPPGMTTPLTLKITNQQIRDQQPVPGGDLTQPDSPWAGMSGAVVVTSNNLILGVVRSHAPAEGTASLALTGLDGIVDLRTTVAAPLRAALGIESVADLAILAPSMDPTERRLQRIHNLARSGYLHPDAVIKLQVRTVLLEFNSDLP